MGVVLVLIAAAAGWMVSGGDASGGPGPAERRAPALEPLALSDEPLWAADELAGRTVVDSPAITAWDDVALLVRHDEFSVVNMATRTGSLVGRPSTSSNTG